MDEHIDSLIARRLSGECNPAENAELNAWIAADPANAAYFAEMEAAWRAMDDVIGGPMFNASAAWEQVAPRLQKAPAQSGNGKPMAKAVQFLPNWLKYATGAAAVLIIAALFLQSDPKEVKVVAMNDNEIIRLPDQSTIRLRKGSSVRYPEHFSATQRLIHLNGEAFFDVSKREDQRFIVDAGSVAVTVLGTSFNVKSGTADADVSVATGRVQVFAKDAGRKLLLRAGRAAHLSNGELLETDAVSNDTAWLNREKVYSNTPLRQILNELGAEADTPIVIDPGVSATLLDNPVPVRFRASDPLRKRLTVLNLVTGTEAVRQGNGYLIRMRR